MADTARFFFWFCGINGELKKFYYSLVKGSDGTWCEASEPTVRDGWMTVAVSCVNCLLKLYRYRHSSKFGEGVGFASPVKAYTFTTTGYVPSVTVPNDPPYLELPKGSIPWVPLTPAMPTPSESSTPLPEPKQPQTPTPTPSKTVEHKSVLAKTGTNTLMWLDAGLVALIIGGIASVACACLKVKQ